MFSVSSALEQDSGETILKIHEISQNVRAGSRDFVDRSYTRLEK